MVAASKRDNSSNLPTESKALDATSSLIPLLIDAAALAMPWMSAATAEVTSALLVHPGLSRMLLTAKLKVSMLASEGTESMLRLFDAYSNNVAQIAPCSEFRATVLTALDTRGYYMVSGIMFGTQQYPGRTGTMPFSGR